MTPLPRRIPAGHLFRTVTALLISSSAWAQTAQPVDPGWLVSSLERVQTLAWPIRLAALSGCRRTAYDYGMFSVSLVPTASAAQRLAWAAFDVIEQTSTVLFTIPHSASAAALSKGDKVIAVAFPDAESAGSMEEVDLDQQLRRMVDHPRVTLTVRRGGELLSIDLSGTRTCAMQFNLDPSRRGNASANGTRLSVDSKLLQILSDDELAFVIGHEMAHMVMEHAPEALDNRMAWNARKQMEIAADRMGVQLMCAAGYDPSSSATANDKIAAATTGRLRNLLGLHGPYLPPRKRTAFLLESARLAPECQRHKQS